MPDFEEKVKWNKNTKFIQNRIHFFRSNSDSIDDYMYDFFFIYFQQQQQQKIFSAWIRFFYLVDIYTKKKNFHEINIEKWLIEIPFLFWFFLYDFLLHDFMFFQFLFICSLFLSGKKKTNEIIHQINLGLNQ